MFLLALVLFVVLVGIVIFLYLLIVKPEGTLTVTYELQGETRSLKVDSLADDLAKLSSLKEQGVLTQDEFDVAKRRLLGQQGDSTSRDPR